MGDWTDRPPAMTFDLHGQSVLEAVHNVERFLESQRKARPGAVVRLVTGRGRGSGGPSPIRSRVRTILKREQERGRLVRNFVMEESEGSFLVRLAG
jgi:DNA-nicking Smr family endonuclease